MSTCEAEILDADAFDAFSQSGDLLNPVCRLPFANTSLPKGGLDDPMTQYMRSVVKCLLKNLFRNRGLN